MKPQALICGVLLAALVAAVPYAEAQSVRTADPVTQSPTEMLTKAEEVRVSDHPEFLRILKQLHQRKGDLTSAQRWHLGYLDAVQLNFEGDPAQAAPILHDIIARSGDPSLSARATAQLVQDNFLSHHYVEAYELASSLITALPGITDSGARQAALSKIVQMLNSVGQYDLALKYARQIKASFPSGKGQCEGNLAVTQAMLYAKMLTSASPDFQKTIALCLGVGEVVSANALRLDLASQLNIEGHPEKAIVLLRQIAPSIREAKYQFHVASLHVTLATAYEMLGNDADARKSALAALAANNADAVNWTVQEANRVLFQVAKRSGDSAAALSYYEKYVGQKQNSADDAKARALAYQMVKQDVLAKKMKLDALSKENKILQLRQTVSDKATETSRLYIALLLMVIASIAFWMYRIKHSQLRFRRLSEHDGMTGAFNRKHFLDVARQCLHRLQKSRTGACLVLLDLDHFKQVNDSHGHAIGDEVLTRTVTICRRELRESDIFGRLGGEEFGILMPCCSCEQGEEIADRIRNTLASTRIILGSGTIVKVSASFGLACSRISGYELPHLLSVADAALYRAKNGGRNRLVVGTDKDEHNIDTVNGDTAAHA